MNQLHDTDRNCHMTLWTNHNAASFDKIVDNAYKTAFWAFFGFTGSFSRRKGVILSENNYKPDTAF